MTSCLRFISFSSARCVVGLIFPQTIDNEGRHYECDLLPLMEVGSVAHKYYLLNMRLPVDESKNINVGIGEIKDIQVVVSEPHTSLLQKVFLSARQPSLTDALFVSQSIHQNGGFTKVWFAMKTFLTPSILIIMIWYWRRITLMSRPPVLLEK